MLAHTPTDALLMLASGAESDPTIRYARFDRLTIAFDDHVLTPRAWTIMQSLWAQELLADLPAGRVLELCAGVGQIGLLAVQPFNRRLLQIDLNPHAVRYATHNARAAEMDARVEVREADVASVLGEGERFPLVIADPPYLRTEQLSAYPGDPQSAVDGGADGLGLVQRVVRVAAGVLTDDGVCLLQVADRDQARAVQLLPARRRHGLHVTEVRCAPEGTVLRMERASDGT